jgi:hypothetical protein
LAVNNLLELPRRAIRLLASVAVIAYITSYHEKYWRCLPTISAVVAGCLSLCMEGESAAINFVAKFLGQGEIEWYPAL